MLDDEGGQLGVGREVGGRVHTVKELERDLEVTRAWTQALDVRLGQPVGHLAGGFDDLAACNEARMSGRPVHLPEPPIQYGDHARCERQRVAGARFDRHVDYRREKLRDAPCSTWRWITLAHPGGATVAPSPATSSGGDSSGRSRPDHGRQPPAEVPASKSASPSTVLAPVPRVGLMAWIGGGPRRARTQPPGARGPGRRRRRRPARTQAGSAARGRGRIDSGGACRPAMDPAGRLYADDRPPADGSYPTSRAEEDRDAGWFTKPRRKVEVGAIAPLAGQARNGRQARLRSRPSPHGEPSRSTPGASGSDSGGRARPRGRGCGQRRNARPKTGWAASVNRRMTSQLGRLWSRLLGRQDATPRRSHRDDRRLRLRPHSPPT